MTQEKHRLADFSKFRLRQKLRATPLNLLLNLTAVCFLFFIPGVALGSFITDGVAIADAWFRMSNFNLCTAVSLWGTTFWGIAKIRQGTKLNPALAKSLAFAMYSINFVCLALVAAHFSPETGDIIDWIFNIFERIFE